MRLVSRALFAPVFLVVLTWPILTGAVCFPRQCVGPENCERSCECVDSNTNQRVACNARFQCNAEAGVCGDDYNSSCQEICERFFVNGACGGQACENDQQCVRAAQCAFADPQGNPICNFTCNRGFACDIDSQTCDPNFAVDDNTLCGTAECFQAGCQLPECAAACQ